MDPGTMLLQALPIILSAVGGLTGDKAKQGSSFSKGQKGGIQDILDSIKNISGGAQDITQNPQFQQGQDWLMSMFNDPEFFKNFEAPLQRQFQEQTVPDLANRFASQGSGGAMGSTGFRNQLAREGSNLHTNIAALRGQMQQGAIPQLMNYAQQPFQNYMSLAGLGTTPYNNTYQGASPNGFGAFAGPLAGGASQYWGANAGQSPSTYGGGEYLHRGY